MPVPRNGSRLGGHGVAEVLSSGTSCGGFLTKPGEGRGRDGRGLQESEADDLRQHRVLRILVLFRMIDANE